LWVNEGEIPENNIDDDYNGYIGDINGWNFSGNQQGEVNDFQHVEYLRLYAGADRKEERIVYSIYTKVKISSAYTSHP